MFSTKHKRRSGSCEFITLDAQFPGVTAEDKLVAVFKDVADALKGCAAARQGTPAGISIDTLATTFLDQFKEMRRALFPSTEVEEEGAPPLAAQQANIDAGAQRVEQQQDQQQPREDLPIDVGAQREKIAKDRRDGRTPPNMDLVLLQQMPGEEPKLRDVVQRQGKNQPAAKEHTDEQIENDHRVAKKLAADLKAHDEAEASKGAKQEDNDTAFTPVTSRKRGKGKGKATNASKARTNPAPTQSKTSTAAPNRKGGGKAAEKKSQAPPKAPADNAAKAPSTSSSKTKGAARGRNSGPSVLENLKPPAPATTATATATPAPTATATVDAIAAIYLPSTLQDRWNELEAHLEEYQRTRAQPIMALSAVENKSNAPARMTTQPLPEKFEYTPAAESHMRQVLTDIISLRKISLIDFFGTEPGLRLVKRHKSYAKVVDFRGSTVMELYHNAANDVWHISHYKGVKAKYRYIIVEKDIVQAWNKYRDQLQETPEPKAFEINNTVSSTSAGLNLDPITMQPITFTTVMRGKDKDLWWNATSVEWRRLYANDTLRFISWDLLPEGAKVTYVSIVVKMKQLLHGELQRRVRVVLGGDQQPVDGPRSSPVATWGQIKTLINSYISTPGAKICTADIKDFYLKSKLTDPAYFQIHIDKLPQDIIDEFNLRGLVNKKGMLLAKVTGGMYGHPQAGLFAYKELRAHLALHGFTSQETTPCVFANADYSVVFTLVVDDFLIKARSEAELKCILDILKLKYEITVDESQQRQFYNGVQFDFDNVSRGGRQINRARLSVPKYISSALRRFKSEDIKGVMNVLNVNNVKYRRYE